jgi:hypothetical protein
MKNFPPLQQKTIKALEACLYDSLDKDICAWRHGPQVDYRVSHLVAILTYSRVVNPNEQYDFGKVCLAAAQCYDQSFFQQVAHCVEIESLPAFERSERPISNRTVMHAYQCAQQLMRENDPRRKTDARGGVILRLYIPSATSVAKEIERMTRKATTNTQARDACARLSINLPLQGHGKAGRPRKAPDK